MTKPKKERDISIQSVVGLTVLLGAYILSVLWIYIFNEEQSVLGFRNKTVVRVVHNMTSREVQAGFRKLAKGYEEKHPDVRVIVQSIPARAYKQWVTTQLIGETAPDLLQAESVWAEWASLATRYMSPLTNIVNRPNPWNEGTPLEGEPWRETYVDGMLGGYWPHLTEFYSIPLTIETGRIYYNKEIFRKAKGDAEPPRTYQEWLEICQKVKDYNNRVNENIVPIAVPMANSNTGTDPFFARYIPQMTGRMCEEYDVSHWGFTASGEAVLFGLYNGTFDLKHPRIRAAFEVIRGLSKYFQPGFVSNDGAQVRFLFTQGKAAMCVGGARDFKVLKDAADFDVGIFDFPEVGKDDPDYGEYYMGSVYENMRSTFHFCLNRESKHPEEAVDFIMYCTSMEANGEFNRELMWYPAIRYSEPLEEMRVFHPHTEGMTGYPEMTFRTYGGETFLKFAQNYPLFLTGEISFDDLMDWYAEQLMETGFRDLFRRDEHFEAGLFTAERNIAKSRIKALCKEAGPLQAGRVVGNRTTYQLSTEVLNLLELGITARKYVYYHLKKGDYDFP